MVASYRALSLSVCFSCVLVGCSESAHHTTLSIVIEGDPAITSTVEEILKQNPEIVATGAKMKYSLIVVKPDPRMNYTIMQIVPDKSVRYAIRVIEPDSGKELTELSREIGRALRRELSRREEPKTPEE